ncbi:MAG TPA: hypothetical protein VN132_15855 [Bdellovibrio sp.]|nr:hypothetical protein [Bdellovibrio sp.]
MKLILFLTLFSSLTYAKISKKMSVEEMKAGLEEQYGISSHQTQCGYEFPELNNESSCDQLRDFVKICALTVTKAEIEVDVSAVVQCK